MSMIDSLVMDPVQETLDLQFQGRARRRGTGDGGSPRSAKVRCGASHFPELQLPVIPLPLDEGCFEVADGSRLEARHQLNLPPGDGVVLWLDGGRRVIKMDPWPAYQVLQRVAKRLGRPLWLGMWTR